MKKIPVKRIFRGNFNESNLKKINKKIGKKRKINPGKNVLLCQILCETE